MADVERVWVDLETTGLNAHDEVILELGLVLTDRWGEMIAGHSQLIYEDHYGGIIDNADDFVKEMHKESGLWAALNTGKGVSLADAAVNALNFLDGHGVQFKKLPMCGSSVGFDRSFLVEHMPGLEGNFHYRNIDVSTVKELCRDLNPRVFENLPAKQEKHRVLPDLDETVNEYKFYVDNFLWVTP